MAAIAAAGRRRSRKEVADIVAVNFEGVPLDQGVFGVDERRHGIIVEKQGVATGYLHIHIRRFLNWLTDFGRLIAD